MNTVTAAALLGLFFAVLVQSAPVPAEPPAAFREAAERAKTLVEKLLEDIPTAHAAAITTQGLTLDAGAHNNLQMMVETLGFPDTPVLKQLSQSFTLDVYVSRMSAGSRLYQGLLGVLSERVTGLSDLRSDLRDLLTQITKMREAAQLGADEDQNPSLDLASRLHGNYEVQVAAHLTLVRLRSFCHDLIRSLRAAASYKAADSVLRSGTLCCIQELSAAFRDSVLRSGTLCCIQGLCAAFRDSVLHSGTQCCVQGLCAAFRDSVLRSGTCRTTLSLCRDIVH
ncbi:colony stimulating factor 3 (granulocyte) a [Scomber japonicus]|uniref:colony stimulating factor 3 (granulocyte) a n=1 Tax=Scomber japonicus TaxID=13676 RepID=UPI00230508B8|nr:colony stimulating factor 3 (granulocyte) a [Scomber japonicus]